MTDERTDAQAVDVNSRGYRERVFEIVRRIPSGHVMTYGQLAEILGEGEFIVIPRGVEHKPVAEEEAHVILVEPKTVLNTGDVVNELTRPELERV